MCGRVVYKVDPQRLAEFGEVRLVPSFQLSTRYNLAPTQQLPAIRIDPKGGRRELVTVRWGLLPFWAKSLKDGVKAINARAETVAEKPAFRNAFKKRRCLIPVSGFYEWQKIDKKTKQPYYIHPANTDLWAFAGLWETWEDKDGDGETVESGTIITTTANTAMQAYHDRMPVILAPESFAEWLDPKTDPKAAQGLLQPCPSEWLAAHAVSSEVGNVRNDNPSLIEPLTPMQI